MTKELGKNGLSWIYKNFQFIRKLKIPYMNLPSPPDFNDHSFVKIGPVVLEIMQFEYHRMPQNKHSTTQNKLAL
jgi:hypothetical protein